MKFLRRYSVFICVLLLVATGRVHAQLPLQIGQNFIGSTYAGTTAAIPPDCNGTVGPNDFVEFINDQFAVYDKATGINTIRLSAVDFWSSAIIGFPSTVDVSDPRIIYDPSCQRWFASMVDLDPNAIDPTLQNNNFLLAVSVTSDPGGDWKGFRFRASPSGVKFADFPTLGVDSNAVYLSGDFFHGSTSPVGPGLVSIPKSDLLLATPTIARRTFFSGMTYAVRGQVLQPVMCFDGTSSGNVVATGNIGMTSDPYSNLVCFAVQNAATASATLTTPVSLNVPPYMVPDNADLGPVFTPTQPDGTSQLQANDARFSARVYGVGGVLYAVHNTELNNHIAIRWYRINASTRALLESGTIADNNQDLFFPAIAASSLGYIVIGYNACGPDANNTVSCYAVAGQTVGGITTFGSPVTLQTGATSYHGDDEVLAGLLDEPAYSRWGDYNAISVDPTDPERFWSIIMHPSDDQNNDVYSTQITELIVAGPPLAIAQTGTNVNVSWPAPAAGFVLQSSTNIKSSLAWTNVTIATVTNGGQISVLLPASNRQQSFRLKK